MNDDEIKPVKLDAAGEKRLARKNKVVGLAIGGLAILIAVVSYFKIDMATP